MFLYWFKLKLSLIRFYITIEKYFWNPIILGFYVIISRDVVVNVFINIVKLS